jgi:tRNA(Ile2) C34 agmatinyltransferase TiaS
MYLHLGNQVIALQKSVIGVFDMDTATWSHRTRETLEKLEQAGQVERRGEVEAAGIEIPKSFVLCSLGSGQTCYLSQLNTATLYKRSKASGLENL